MKKYLTLTLFVFTVIAASAQVDPVDQYNIAIGGYDVVSYFEKGAPEKGAAAYSTKYDGVTYWFTSAENQKLFASNPAKYVPAYGGYCALAISYGKKISIDPQTFKVKDGKLFLFFNGKTSRGKVNSLDTWNKNEERLYRKAEANWPSVKNAKYKKDDSF